MESMIRHSYANMDNWNFQALLLGNKKLRKSLVSRKSRREEESLTQVLDDVKKYCRDVYLFDLPAFATRREVERLVNGDEKFRVVKQVQVDAEKRTGKVSFFSEAKAHEAAVRLNGMALRDSVLKAEVSQYWGFGGWATDGAKSQSSENNMEKEAAELQDVYEEPVEKKLLDLKIIHTAETRQAFADQDLLIRIGLSNEEKNGSAALFGPVTELVNRAPLGQPLCDVNLQHKIQLAGLPVFQFTEEAVKSLLAGKPSFPLEKFVDEWKSFGAHTVFNGFFGHRYQSLNLSYTVDVNGSVIRSETADDHLFGINCYDIAVDTFVRSVERLVSSCPVVPVGLQSELAFFCRSRLAEGEFELAASWLNVQLEPSPSEMAAEHPRLLDELVLRTLVDCSDELVEIDNCLYAVNRCVVFVKKWFTCSRLRSGTLGHVW